MASPSGSGSGKGRGKGPQKDPSKVPGTGPSTQNPAAAFWQQPIASHVKKGPSVAHPKPFPAPSPRPSLSSGAPRSGNTLDPLENSASATQSPDPIRSAAPVNSTPAADSSQAAMSAAHVTSSRKSGDDAPRSPDKSEEAHNTEHADLEPGNAPVEFARPQLAGESGEKIQIRTNMIRLTISSKVEAFYVYSFSFPPISGRELKNRGVKRSLIQEVLRQPPFSTEHAQIATDWNTLLISTVDLSSNDDALVNGSSKSVNVSWQNQNSTTPQTVVVDVALVHTLPVKELAQYWKGSGNTNVAPHLAALNILARKVALHRQASQSQIVKVGRDKFFWQLDNPPPGRWPSGLEPRQGYFSSALAVSGGIAVNVHNVTSAFITHQPLLAYVQKQLGNLNNTSLFKAITNQLQVRLRYNSTCRGPLLPDPCRAGHLRRINGFGRSARLQTFYHDELKQSFTVEKYYNEHILQPPGRVQQSDVIVVNVGSRDHPVWVPPELLYIEPHQPLRGQLDDTDMANMLAVAQKTPANNASLIEAAVTGPMFNRTSPLWTGVRLGIQAEMMKTDARMLPILPFVYASNSSPKEQELRKGKWNLRGKRLHTPTVLNALGVIEIGPGGGDPHIYEPLARGMTQYGITTQRGRQRDVQLTVASDATSGSLQKAFNQLSSVARESGIILIALPGRDKKYDEYASVKDFFDTRLGVHTVCVTGGKLNKLGGPTFQANLALKFNVKLGGRNHVMADSAQKLLHSKGGSTMVVGADVTHPGVGAVPHCPSIAALVASCDPYAVTYPGSMRLQRSKQEMIEDLESMMAERLALWAKRNNGNLPMHILFFRDGVSDSQFAMVQEHELPKIRAGCDRAGRDHGVQGYSPKITLITCGKRHHTRFYAPKKPDATVSKWLDRDTNNNFFPGLVVDDPAIRNPYTFDFYLQSHSALKGTARPCHYFVIENQSDWSSNDLQAVTFSLCWVFATALTPISYAAPAYYADRLCERGRRYLWALLKKTHGSRPTDDAMLANFVHPATGHATEEQKHDHALSLVQQGLVGTWQAQVNKRNNPYTDRLKDVMFYI